ncbi:hypothetical protein EW146_g9862 [Bondarzewia mesenterica]|uniref:Uncharacterized protein n=1 Tax=Bondarzewia mesenterica TaxID=1095465 RepID=A0A4S4L2U0_9AGAM|nr:hypothetical protein EW146_g9862 [Bondarzewia mesenterica]
MVGTRGIESALSTAEDRTPAGTNTPILGPEGGGGGGGVDTADVDELVTEGARGTTLQPQPTPVPPTMYRWVSTARPTDPDRTMVLSFSVPTNALSREAKGGKEEKARREGVDRDRGDAVCAVRGCGKDRKYRLVRDWTRGACGMEHLKVLQGAMSA